MIKLKNLISEVVDDDKKRIVKAFEFFKNILNIDVTVTLVYENLPEDDGDLKYTRSNGGYTNFKIRLSERDVDKLIRAAAHELTHVKQLTSGKLDIEKQIWNGKPMEPVKNYWYQPWEVEARTQSEELWKQFNKMMRNGGLLKESNIRSIAIAWLNPKGELISASDHNLWILNNMGKDPEVKALYHKKVANQEIDSPEDTSGMSDFYNILYKRNWVRIVVDKQSVDHSLRGVYFETDYQRDYKSVVNKNQQFTLWELAIENELPLIWSNKDKVLYSPPKES